MESAFIYLLSDYKSLDLYVQAKEVSLKKIQSNLFLLCRSKNSAVPDHYYRAAQQKEFSGVKSTSDLLLRSFTVLSKEYLDITTSGQLSVKNDLFGEWQKLITKIPPLVILCKKLCDSKQIDNLNASTIQSYFKQFIEPNFLFTALPHPKINEIEQFIVDRKGLHDLHIHLNGSVETDNVWQDYLRRPDRIYKDLRKGFKKLKVEEQFEQESHLLSPYKFYQLLLAARKIRQLLYKLVFDIDVNDIKNQTFQSLFSKIVYDNQYQIGSQSFKHPFKHMINTNSSNVSDLSSEALMYILVFDSLKRKQDPTLAFLFHFYLLIKGLCNKLLVQQEHQHGFEQFQKHTFNTLRDLNEEKYQQRFFQIHGNEKRNIRFLEGRFAPKVTYIENRVLLSSIKIGWEFFEKKNKSVNPDTPELKLITHFIKKPENDGSQFIRFKHLREELFKKARLVSILVKKATFRHLITGADAAANELDTPPEVFGPVFRKLRRDGVFKNFTYHTGEDFFHIISGLRAIYEAVEFTGLEKGDRIGHATATGISYNIWIRALGDKIPMKMGEWLDDLIFVIHLRRKLNITCLQLQQLEGKAIRYIKLIYGDNHTIEDYIISWTYRRYCPILAFSENYSIARLKSVFDDTEWQEIKLINKDTGAFRLFQLYHSLECRKRHNELIEVTLPELFNKTDIENLQVNMLEYIADKGIVLETLPSSNVRISHYKDYSEHHLFRWKEWSEANKKIPDIVVGSDDTGIFATNILNEYIHIYGQLISNKSGKALSSNEAIEYLKVLDANGKQFKFQRT